MKVAAAVDREGMLTPLEQGEKIVVIEDGSIVRSYSNPGYGFRHGGKEKAMELILEAGVDAVFAKEGFLCPCSYSMSLGKVKYIKAGYSSLHELLANFQSVHEFVREELEEEMYAEEDHHHESKVNASLDI